MNPLCYAIQWLSMLFDLLRGIPAEWAEERDGGRP